MEDLVSMNLWATLAYAPKAGWEKIAKTKIARDAQKADATKPTVRTQFVKAETVIRQTRLTLFARRIVPNV